MYLPMLFEARHVSSWSCFARLCCRVVLDILTYMLTCSSGTKLKSIRQTVRKMRLDFFLCTWTALLAPQLHTGPASTQGSGDWHATASQQITGKQVPYISLQSGCWL